MSRLSPHFSKKSPFLHGHGKSLFLSFLQIREDLFIYLFQHSISYLTDIPVRLSPQFCDFQTAEHPHCGEIQGFLVIIGKLIESFGHIRLRYKLVNLIGAIENGVDEISLLTLLFQHTVHRIGKTQAILTGSIVYRKVITATADGAKHLDINLTKAKFDELTADLVEATAEPVRTALSDAGLTASDLSKVLLVGGSTRIPAVQDKVRQLTGHEPSKNLNPDECVAIGASIQGGKLAGDAGAGDVLLLDVTPLTLSIETMGGIATPLIPRNTTIPTKKSQIFSTAADNQTAVDINVVQGERKFARDNKSLGQFRLDGIPPAMRGVPQIEVTFDIDANGIVNVSAKDLGTGKEQHITITSGSSMSDAEIDKAVKEAAQYEAEDKKRKDAVDTKNEADSTVFQVEKALKEVGDKVPADQKSGVEADLNALKDLLAKAPADGSLTDAQVTDIKAAKEKLMNSSQALFTKMYESMQQNQGGPDPGQGPQGGSSAGNNGGDDVVDADYKEV